MTPTPPYISELMGIPDKTQEERIAQLERELERGPWIDITPETLPPLDEPVWLIDGDRIWIGGRADDVDGWLWGDCYGNFWWNGQKWVGEIHTDDEYKPTKWAPLIEGPKSTN